MRELTFDEVMLVSGGTDWGQVVEGGLNGALEGGTVGAATGLVAGAVTGGPGGAAGGAFVGAAGGSLGGLIWGAWENYATQNGIINEEPKSKAQTDG